MNKVNIVKNCIQLYSFVYYLRSDGLHEERFEYRLDKCKLIDILRVKKEELILSEESFVSYNNFINQEVERDNTGMLKIYLFITILLWRVLTEKSQPYGYYKALSNSYLHKFFRYEDIATIINILEAADLLETKPHSKGRWSKSYRFHHNLKLLKTIQLGIRLVSV